MLKKARKLFSIFSIAVFVLVALLISGTSALVSQNVFSWYWTSDTNVSAVATGDVNADGKTEIVTTGFYNDGLRWNAQVIVWNGSNLSVEKIAVWNWNDTQIASVAIGDVNGDGQTEIVTGGSYFDGVRWNAQLVVCNGLTLTPIGVKTWYWNSDTQIATVAVANISLAQGLDIVTGGSYFDGTRWNAQLVVLNGPTLAPTKVLPWFWTSDTFVNSIAVANITGGPSLSIVVGDSFSDGIRYNAQLIVLNASTLAWQNGFSWFWTGDTFVNSVAVANITGGTALSIVTGGSYFDGTRNVAQLLEFNGTTLAWQNGFTWYWTADTVIKSIVVGNYTGGANLDIATGGFYSDGFKNNAQLAVFNSATLAVQSVASWFDIAGTQANSVAIGNFGYGNRVVAGGAYYDLIRSNAQISLWG